MLKTRYAHRNSKRRWKSTVSSIIATSRLQKGGIAGAAAREAIATPPVESDSEGEEEDGYHTGEEGEVAASSKVEMNDLRKKLESL